MSAFKDGNYLGKAWGHNGEITVNVEIVNGAIKQVNILDEHEDHGIGEPALLILEDEIKQKQSYIVDVVSGATNTSNGVKAAVKDALDKARVLAH